ncbi:MAG TPA: hypothetical protein VLH60_05745, partial [Sedimentisphaerales bacterium]|nr:hypothetical protein [Sedimentisphaerales bacterium]
AIHYSATMISAEAEARDLASARDSCLRAIGMIKDNPSLLASAKLQLGLCLEGMGKFDEAAAIYREILNDPQFAGDVAVAQATTRLAIMDDFRSPVLLAPPLAAQPAVMELAPAVEPTQPLVDVVEAGAAPEPNAGE